MEEGTSWCAPYIEAIMLQFNKAAKIAFHMHTQLIPKHWPIHEVAIKLESDLWKFDLSTKIAK